MPTQQSKKVMKRKARVVVRGEDNDSNNNGDNDNIR
jgi:hypothetical protein